MVEFNFAEDAIEGHISAQLLALTMLKFNRLSFNHLFQLFLTGLITSTPNY